MFVLDKFSDIYATLFLCIVGLLGFGIVSHYSWIVFSLVIITTAITVGLFKPKLLLKGLEYISNRIKILSNNMSTIISIIRNNSELMNSPLFLSTLILSVLGWFAECLALYLLLQYLGADISLLQAIFIFSIANIAGAVSLLPGGLIGVEVTMFGLLISFGCHADQAMSATIIIRLTTLWFAVGLGFLSLPFAFYLKQQRLDDSAVIINKKSSSAACRGNISRGDS